MILEIDDVEAEKSILWMLDIKDTDIELLDKYHDHIMSGNLVENIKQLYRKLHMNEDRLCVLDKSEKAEKLRSNIISGFDSKAKQEEILTKAEMLEYIILFLGIEDQPENIKDLYKFAETHSTKKMFHDLLGLYGGVMRANG